MFNNVKNVPYYMFGRGALAQLGDLVNVRRKAAPGAPAVFCLDHFFKGSDLEARLPRESGDITVYADTSVEPTVEAVDALSDSVKARLNGMRPCCLVGLGGGAALDTAKAVGNLLTNPGKAEEYQGWELVKNPAVHKIGVPTLSGTGAECSRTCVLTNERKGLKLGMNSDFTMYDQLLLDPELTRSVPRTIYFYTGLDAYMHCMEALRGKARNPVVDALARTTIELCRDVFLRSDDMMSDENLEKLMVASYMTGMAAGSTGLVHPLSAGLSIVLHTPHCRANCHVLSVLGEFYPEEHKDLEDMLKRQNIELPRGICAKLSEADLERLYNSSIIHEKPLANHLGPDFRQILTKEKLIGLFKKM